MSEPDDDLRAELEWLTHNQSALDARLQRVEDSMVFRTLRAIGGFYQRHFQQSTEAAERRYRKWRARHSPPSLSPESSWIYQPLISVVCDVRETDSVRAQTYKHWELCATAADAKGDYRATLNSGDVLEPGCLAAAVQAMQTERPKLVYFDHQETDASGTPKRPVFKPDWSPVLMESCDYIGPFVLSSRQETGPVVHIPELLYSTQRPLEMKRPERPSFAEQPPVSIVICSRDAVLLANCLEALRRMTKYPAPEIVVIHHIGFGDDEKLEQIIQVHQALRVPYSGPFNFAEMNNLGTRAASGAILVFLNDDVTPLSDDWLSVLVARLQSGAGVTGAKLLYPNGAIQHAGVVTWLIDGAGHPGRNVVRADYWPWLNCTREVTAVTGACMAVRKADFERIGGFDPQYPVNYNDVDLCLRLREAGLSVIFEAAAVLRHDESRTRIRGVSFDERKRLFKRWRTRVEQVDPYYSPHLAQNNEDLSLRA